MKCKTWVKTLAVTGMISTSAVYAEPSDRGGQGYGFGDGTEQMERMGAQIETQVEQVERATYAAERLGMQSQQAGRAANAPERMEHVRERLGMQSQQPDRMEHAVMRMERLQMDSAFPGQNPAMEQMENQVNGQMEGEAVISTPTPEFH